MLDVLNDGRTYQQYKLPVTGEIMKLHTKEHSFQTPLKTKEIIKLL
jgi:hypothetical protein